MTLIVDTVFDTAKAISTDNIKTWEIFNLLVKENNILKISLNSSIKVMMKTQDNSYIFENTLVSGVYDELGNLQTITPTNILSPTYSTPIGLTYQDIPQNSYGYATLVGKIVDLQGRLYTNIIGSELTYCQLFLNNDNRLITTDEVITSVLSNNDNYLVTTGLKLNTNEIYFYPMNSISVTDFLNPVTKTYNYVIGEDLSRGDLLHIDPETNIVYKANITQQRYNILGILKSANITSQTFPQPIEVIERGFVPFSSNHFPSFSLEDITLAQSNVVNLYIQESGSYQIGTALPNRYRVINVGWLYLPSGETEIQGFYFNVYPVTIDNSVLPQKNITFAIPSRNINAMDEITVYDFYLQNNEVMYFIEGQVNYVNPLTDISLLNENLFVTVKGYSQIKDYKFDIYYRQATYPTTAQTNQRLWLNDPSLPLTSTNGDPNYNNIFTYNGTAWVLSPKAQNDILYNQNNNTYYRWNNVYWEAILESEVPSKYSESPTLNLIFYKATEFTKNNFIQGPAKIQIKFCNHTSVMEIGNGYISTILLKNV